MPFVQVIGADVKAQRAKRMFPADAEDNLLLQALRSVASVEAVGDISVLGLVLIDVCIEQQDGYAAAGA